MFQWFFLVNSYKFHFHHHLIFLQFHRKIHDLLLLLELDLYILHALFHQPAFSLRNMMQHLLKLHYFYQYKLHSPVHLHAHPSYNNQLCIQLIYFQDPYRLHYLKRFQFCLYHHNAFYLHVILFLSALPCKLHDLLHQILLLDRDT